MNKLTSVAVIPDGNRRYAAKANVSLDAAYLAGFKKTEEFVKWGYENGVKSASFWALSLENFQNRSDGELNTIFRFMNQNIAKLLTNSNVISNYDCKVQFFGKTELLPEKLKQDIIKLEQKTKDNKEYELNIAIAYSGQDELTAASRKIAEEVKLGKLKIEDITTETFQKHLYYQKTPELIIRTGDVQRTSGFLPFQATYSELYFSHKLWPEFTKTDFEEAKTYYEQTERRFGK